MKSYQGLWRFIGWFSLFTVFLFGLHYGIGQGRFWQNQALAPFIKNTYLFLFLLNTAGYALVFKLSLKEENQAGFAFLGLSVIKLMVATAFLWQPLHHHIGPKAPIILHFMAPYLLMLLAEVAAVKRLL